MLVESEPARVLHDRNLKHVRTTLSALGTWNSVSISGSFQCIDKVSVVESSGKIIEVDLTSVDDV